MSRRYIAPFLLAVFTTSLLTAAGGMFNVINGTTGPDTLAGTAGDDDIYGRDKDDRLFGKAGDDRLSGDYGWDILFGDDGNDILYGGQGRDRMHGGDGSDKMFGGTEPDEMYGNTGFDLMDGGEGDDRIFGDRGDDRLFGREGRDLLDGGPGNDRIVGGAGDDSLDGGPGRNFMIGGPGRDSISVRPNTSTDKNIVYGGDNNDSVTGASGDDEIYGETGFDFLNGLGGSDLIDGGPGSDQLFGGEGNDRLIGGPGDDRLNGGPGQDVAVYQGISSKALQVDLFSGYEVNVTSRDSDGSMATDRLRGVESVELSDGVFPVQALSNRPVAGNRPPVANYDEFFYTQLRIFADRSRNAEYLDVLQNDIDQDADELAVISFTQPDAGKVEYVQQVNTEGTTRRLVYFPPLSDPPGLVTFEYTIQDGRGGIASSTVAIFAIVDRFGTRGDDVIVGDDSADSIHGSDGNDRLSGEGANDIIEGGDGDDTLIGGTGSDTLRGGLGTDTAVYPGIQSSDVIFELVSGAFDEVPSTWDGGSNEFRISVLTRNGFDRDTLRDVELIEFDDGVFTYTELARRRNTPGNSNPVARGEVIDLSDLELDRFGFYRIRESDLLANDTDPDGDDLIVIFETPTPRLRRVYSIEQRLRGEIALVYPPQFHGFQGVQNLTQIRYGVYDRKGGYAQATVTIIGIDN